jgi:hypothetical protein
MMRLMSRAVGTWGHTTQVDKVYLKLGHPKCVEKGCPHGAIRASPPDYSNFLKK